MKRFLLLAALAAWLPAQAVNKCTLPDGAVVYSDAPCPAASKESKALVERPVPAPLRAASAPRIEPPVSPPARVEFTGAPQMDLIRATALMDNIRLLGRDCEWALKVDESKMGACRQFLGKLQPGGEFEQIGARVLGVLKELQTDPPAAQQAAGDMRTLMRYTQDVARYKEFLLARLRTR